MGVTARGYVMLRVPGHPRGGANGMVFEHIIVVERAIGHHLPRAAVVHHVDGDKQRNVGSNLVACEDQAYHLLLHRRARALRECGDPNKVQCYFCREWALPETLAGRRQRGQYHHLDCAARWQQEFRDKARAGRPRHLEMVAARPTCKHGHPWTEESTRVYDGTRFCRVCERSRNRTRRAS